MQLNILDLKIKFSIVVISECFCRRSSFLRYCEASGF